MVNVDAFVDVFVFICVSVNMNANSPPLLLFLLRTHITLPYA